MTARRPARDTRRNRSRSWRLLSSAPEQEGNGKHLWVVRDTIHEVGKRKVLDGIHEHVLPCSAPIARRRWPSASRAIENQQQTLERQQEEFVHLRAIVGQRKTIPLSRR